MATLNIDGQTYTLNSDKVQELVQWLQTNGAVKLESADKSNYDGQTLLNEGERDPSRQPKGDPNKTWDFGTPWA